MFLGSTVELRAHDFQAVQLRSKELLRSITA